MITDIVKFCRYASKLAYESAYSSTWVCNKAGYTATPAGAGGQGQKLRSPDHLGRSSEAKNRKKNNKKVKCDGRTDKAGCRVA